MKCDNCLIKAQADNSDIPSCCAWYLDNVVCGDKSLDECPEYKTYIGNLNSQENA